MGGRGACMYAVKDVFSYKSFCSMRTLAERLSLDSQFEEKEDMGHQWELWDPALSRAMDFFEEGRKV